MRVATHLESLTGTRRPALVRYVAALWGGTIVAALAIGAVGPARWRAVVGQDGPGCPFHAITGVNCPFCGMTRATIALGHGDWHDALVLHPLAPLVLAGILGLLVVVSVGRGDLLLRGRRPLVLLGSILAIWGFRLAVG